VVQLLAKTFIRVGNEEYARTNGAIGLTTMKDRHAVLAGSSVRFEFRGKSGVRHTVDLRDRRLTRVIRACRDLPGQELFQWIDEGGARQSIDSSDVNGYLREASGSDFSAKDFRTWAGTVLAVRALSELPLWDSAAQAKRNVVRCVEDVSKQLGNTKAVCRKSYIHPAVLDTYQQDRFALRRVKDGRRAGGLTAEEAGIVKLLQGAATVTKSSRPSSRPPKKLAA
jgi:DNA topoisomerase I